LQTVALNHATFSSSGEGSVLTALEQATVSSRVVEPTTRVSDGFRPRWMRTYARRLAVTDAVAIVGSVAIAQLVRFGADTARFRSESLVYSYTALSAALILAWLVRPQSGEPRVVVNARVEGAKLRAVRLRLKRLEFAGGFGRPALRRTSLLVPAGERSVATVTWSTGKRRRLKVTDILAIVGRIR
jgi:hypothetical protein